MSVTLNFVPSDFTYNRPTFVGDETYVTNLEFANTGITFNLESTNHGYAVFTISYTGNLDFVYATFYQKDGESVSVSESLDGFFNPSSQDNPILCTIKDKTISGNTKTFYVVVNASDEIKSNYLFIQIAVGVIDTIPVTSSVTIDYTCPTAIYNYETGLHTYSDYDAIESIAKLTTKLYSFTDINSWDIDTMVYADPFMGNPALPWYYGIGPNVYKVGGPFDRSFGTTKEYEVRKKIIGKTRIREKTIGPKSFYDSVHEESPACVEPIMSNVGKIRGIIPTGSTIQPQQYRYYMGYDPSLIKESNDSVFTIYSWSRKQHYPITGSIHALLKLREGIITGTISKLKIRNFAYATLPFIADYIISKVTGGSIKPVLGNLFKNTDFEKWVLDYLLGPNSPFRKNVIIPVKKFFKSLVNILLETEINPIPWLMAAWVLYKLFIKVYKIHIYEPCKIFLHHFTNTPYIELSSDLYRKPDLSEINTGYYCDGVYYYRQQPSGLSSNTIVRKTPSYTDVLISEDPLQFEFQYSLIADKPTLVTDYEKLIVLSYTSGKPMPYCNGNTIYYNTQKFYDFTPTGCCDFEICNPVQLTLPPEIVFSCVSQQDAEDKADEIYQSIINYANDFANYIETRPDEEIGTLLTYFTHELKIEDNPTVVQIFYDLVLTPNVVIGTVLYFDSCGCNKVLDGYYAISGDTVYRTFYHTTNGAVDGIYEMLTSSSTTTVTSEPIITTNLDYSSNWYLFSLSYDDLYSYSSEIIYRPRNFDPNSLYTSPVLTMKKGFIKTPTTQNNFQLYNNFITTSYAEADEGYYQPLIDFIEIDPFYYYKDKTIYLHIEEYCDYLSNPSITTRGFYIIGKNILDELRPTINAVDLTVKVYDGAILLDTYSIITETYNAKTFVTFDSNKINITTNITQIVISSINSSNPLNKITYEIGTSTLCNGSCNLTLSVTNTSTQATVTVSGGTPNYSYIWTDENNVEISSISNEVSTTNTITGLTPNTTYNISVVDSLGCSNTLTFITNVPIQQSSDYIVLSYIWGDSQQDFWDVTRIMKPDFVMYMGADGKPVNSAKDGFGSSPDNVESIDTVFAHVAYGYGRFGNLEFPTLRYVDTNSSTPSIEFGLFDPNKEPYLQTMGTIPLHQFNSVLINLSRIKEDFPNATEIKIDCRGHWNGVYSTTKPVTLQAEFYSGGTMILTDLFSPLIGRTWLNSTYNSYSILTSTSKTVTPQIRVKQLLGGTRPQVGNYWKSGQRIGVLVINLLNNIIYFDMNDQNNQI